MTEPYNERGVQRLHTWRRELAMSVGDFKKNITYEVR